MSPYEIEKEGGRVEGWKDDRGKPWLHRLRDAYPKAVWLNPVPQKYWTGTSSIGMIRQIVEDRMFPLTLDGLDCAMRRLTRCGSAKELLALGSPVLRDAPFGRSSA